MAGTRKGGGGLGVSWQESRDCWPEMEMLGGCFV